MIYQIEYSPLRGFNFMTFYVMEGIGSVGFDFSGIVHVKITRKKKN